MGSVARVDTIGAMFSLAIGLAFGLLILVWVGWLALRIYRWRSERRLRRLE
jgi:hypothetical protein